LTDAPPVPCGGFAPYRESVRFRLVKSVVDIMRDYPELPGREHWSDRVIPG
jgi:hypothetical protein